MLFVLFINRDIQKLSIMKHIQFVNTSLLQYNLKKLKQNFLSYFLESNARSANDRLFFQL